MKILSGSDRIPLRYSSGAQLLHFITPFQVKSHI